MWALSEGNGVLAGGTRSCRAWLRCPGQCCVSQTRLKVIFRTIGWPGFKNVLGLFFWRRPKSASRQHGTSVAGCRGGRSRARAELGWMGPRSQQCRNRPGAANREGETTRQPVPKPQAGNGTAAGCTEEADSELFSICPCESQISRPPFGEVFPGKQPGPRSSLLGAAQGGRAGRAWAPPPSL